MKVFSGKVVIIPVIMFFWLSISGAMAADTLTFPKEMQIKEGSGALFKTIYVTKAGETLEVLQVKGAWQQVKTPNGPGWIYTKSLEAAQTGKQTKLPVVASEETSSIDVTAAVKMDRYEPGFPGGEYKARVVLVFDGGAMKVELPGRHGNQREIRLEGIACPRKGQPYHHEAKMFTYRYTSGKPVTVSESGKQEYGQNLAVVNLQDGLNLNEALVRNGLAWVKRENFKDSQKLLAIERHARKEGRGLWADRHPIPPWKWDQDTGVLKK